MLATDNHYNENQMHQNYSQQQDENLDDDMFDEEINFKETLPSEIQQQSSSPKPLQQQTHPIITESPINHQTNYQQHQTLSQHHQIVKNKERECQDQIQSSPPLIQTQKQMYPQYNHQQNHQNQVQKQKMHPQQFQQNQQHHPTQNYHQSRHHHQHQQQNYQHQQNMQFHQQNSHQQHQNHHTYQQQQQNFQHHQQQAMQHPHNQQQIQQTKNQAVNQKQLQSKQVIMQCLQPLTNLYLQNRIRVSVRLPTNDKYLLMLDKNTHTTVKQFNDYITTKFQLPTHFKSDQGGFLIKEVNQERINNLNEICKNDQLCIQSQIQINQYAQQQLQQQQANGCAGGFSFSYNPKQQQQQLLNKRVMPGYFDIFGHPQNIAPNIKQAFQTPVIPQQAQQQDQMGYNQQFNNPASIDYNPLQSKEGYAQNGYNVGIIEQQRCPYYYKHWAYEQKFSELVGFVSPMPGIPAPRKLREKFDYLNMENVEIWIETPDFLDFATGLHFLRNREELVNHLRIKAAERGFKLNLPYGKPSDKQCFNCSRSGKKKSNSSLSKKTGCPFSMIYKKKYLASSDGRQHPSFSIHNSIEQLSQDDGKYGVYYLSKFRGLHNHPLEMSNIYAEFKKTEIKTVNENTNPYIQEIASQIALGKKFCDEKELQGKYECEALDDLMAYESKKFEKAGRFTLRMRNLKSNTQNLEIHVSNPECGEPQLLLIIDDDEIYEYLDKDQINETLEEAREVCVKMFEKIENTALEQIKRDKKPSISSNIHQLRGDNNHISASLNNESQTYTFDNHFGLSQSINNQNMISSNGLGSSIQQSSKKKLIIEIFKKDLVLLDLNKKKNRKSKGKDSSEDDSDQTLSDESY
eukprot:403371678